VAANRSNSALNEETDAGGGGISSRNTTLIELRGTTIEDNLAQGFAGGGIYFISSDEGDIVRDWTLINLTYPTPNFDWNNVLLDIFGFTGAELSIDAATRIRRNRAEVLPGRNAGDPGKGGALYVLRYNGTRTKTRSAAERVTPTIVGRPVTIAVDDVASLDATNVSTFAGATRLYLDDQSPPPTVQKDTELPASGGYRYP
jgi:hypothetical protein